MAAGKGEVGGAPSPGLSAVGRSQTRRKIVPSLRRASAHTSWPCCRTEKRRGSCAGEGQAHTNAPVRAVSVVVWWACDIDRNRRQVLVLGGPHQPCSGFARSGCVGLDHLARFLVLGGCLVSASPRGRGRSTQLDGGAPPSAGGTDGTAGAFGHDWGVQTRTRTGSPVWCAQFVVDARRCCSRR